MKVLTDEEIGKIWFLTDKPYLVPRIVEQATIKKMNEKYKKMHALIEELLESAEYWSEYDVPLGIVDRMREVLEE